MSTKRGTAVPAVPDGKADATRERAVLIRLIHVGRREIQMSDDAWRAYLQQAFLVQSSTQLSLPRLRTALAHLRRLGFGQAGEPHEWRWVDTAVPARQTLLRKLIKLMQATGVARGRQVAYVEGIAKQMAGANVDAETRSVVQTPLAMCDVVMLRGIVAALVTHIKRQAGDAAADA